MRFPCRNAILFFLLFFTANSPPSVPTILSEKPTRVAAPSPRASLGRRTVCERTEQRRPPVSKRHETKLRMVWGEFSYYCSSAQNTHEKWSQRPRRQPHFLLVCVSRAGTPYCSLSFLLLQTRPRLCLRFRVNPLRCLVLYSKLANPPPSLPTILSVFVCVCLDPIRSSSSYTVSSLTS